MNEHNNDLDLTNAVGPRIEATALAPQALNGHHHDEEAVSVGVYICRCGGNISDVVDVEAVAAAVKHIPGVTVSSVNTFMCSDPGQQMIQTDIPGQRLNRVVVASCSPSLHELTFRGAVKRGGLNPYLYEHVNIREQGSWAHKHDPAGATAKAIRQIAGAVNKLRHARPLDTITLPNHRTALVIGGGIAGLKAAGDLAARGIRVLLVEKSDRLGGKLNDWGRVFPGEEPAETLVARLRERLAESDNAEVLLETEVTGISGFIGNFTVQLTGQFGPAGTRAAAEVTVGVIIVATGFQPYQPRRGEYAYGDEPAVLTMPEFITLTKDQPERGEGYLVHKGKTIRSMAFIHCVGSRQVEGVQAPQADGKINEYCSRVCCTTTLQQALHARRQFPKTRVFDLHQDIRTYGRGHENYYVDAAKAGVTFFRWHGDEPPVVSRNDTGLPGAPPLKVAVKDYLTWGEELEIPVDMVVLAVGMMAGKIRELVDMLKLPVGDDRFLQEIHPKLRPVEVSVNGVLLAGTAQGPMNIVESLDAGAAAAAKASAMFSKPQVELAPFVAAVVEDRCMGTGLCVQECLYDGALTMVEKEVDGRRGRVAEVNPGLCVGCGACAAVCPYRAIDLQGWTIDQYDAMVDGIVAGVPAPAAVG